MSDSPIKIKLADALVMGEWVARYWNGSFVGWHMVVKPFRANIVLTASRTVDEPVQEFEIPADALVEVWAGQGEPPYYGPGDYKNAKALQGLKEENARLKEENAQLDVVRKERDAARKERDRVSADLVCALHTLEEIESFVGKPEGEGLIKGKARTPWGIARHLSLPLDLLPKDPGFGVCMVLSWWRSRGHYEYYVEVPPNHIDAPDPPDWLVPIFAYAREHNAHGVLFHSWSKTKYDPLTSPKMRG